jgi:single-strand DNA-binding protein
LLFSVENEGLLFSSSFPAANLKQILMYSSTTLIGHLGQDPEMKTLANGSTVTRLSLATNRSWKNDAGEKQEETQWHNVILWGKKAELAEKYLNKGSKVLITGRLSYRKVEQDNGTRQYTDIVANEMKFLDSRSNDDRFPSAPSEASAAKPKEATAATGEDKDLPF